MNRWDSSIDFVRGSYIGNSPDQNTVMIRFIMICIEEINTDQY